MLIPGIPLPEKFQRECGLNFVLSFFTFPNPEVNVGILHVPTVEVSRAKSSYKYVGNM